MLGFYLMPTKNSRSTYDERSKNYIRQFFFMKVKILFAVAYLSCQLLGENEHLVE